MMSRVGAIASLLLVAASAQAELPADVQRDLWNTYGSTSKPTRYLAGRIDLDGNGREEIVVHLSGRKACTRKGCTTAIYAPDGKDGYRRVASIAATILPIGAGTARSAGWRDLIVHVRGGRAKSTMLELFFDGTTYPANPHARDPLIVPAKTPGDIIIAAADSPDGGELLTQPVATGVADTVDTVAVKAARQHGARHDKPTAGAQATSFNCAIARANAEKTVCATPELAALDRELAAAFAKLLQGQPEEREAAMRSEQHNWTITRNACAKQAEAVGCIGDAYRRRLTEVRIQAGTVQAVRKVTYVCEGRNGPLTVSFYSEPAAVELVWGKRRVIAHAVAGEARYARDDLEFRDDLAFTEKPGGAAVTWGTAKLDCTTSP